MVLFASKLLEVESPQSTEEGLVSASQYSQKPVKKKMVLDTEVPSEPMLNALWSNVEV